MEYSDGIELWNDTNIRAITMEETYKYYDVLEAENLLYAQVEKNSSSKYVKWCKIFFYN